MQPLPPELLDALDAVLLSRVTEVPSPPHGRTVRACVALECWLHGSVTTEQALQVMRAQPPPLRLRPKP